MILVSNNLSSWLNTRYVCIISNDIKELKRLLMWHVCHELQHCPLTAHTLYLATILYNNKLYECNDICIGSGYYMATSNNGDILIKTSPPSAQVATMRSVQQQNHTTELPWNILETPLKLDTFFQHPWKFLETSLKLS